MEQMLTQWRNATADLPWGAQHVLHTTLDSVAKDGVHLVHGADYRDGKPCLINAAGSMLTSGGGVGVPSRHFSAIVRLFDQINRELMDKGVNDASGYVSPLAAEILLRHFAPLKEVPAEANQELTLPDAPYVEPTDEELTNSWLEAMKAPPLDEVMEPARNPIDGFNKDFIKASAQHALFRDDA